MTGGGGISPALDFCAGTVAGVASLLTGHPFDTIKVRLQTQSPTAVTTSAASNQLHLLRYNGAWHACTRIVREEGARGLYKGVTSPMLGIALMNASVFTSYKYTMSRILLDSPDQEPTLAQITIAGSASGIFTSVITTPIERLKILQQAPVPTAATTTKNMVESLDPRRQPSLVSLLKTHSIRSLYRGFVPTLMRDTAYGPYFLMYEYVSRGGSFGLLSSPSSSLKSKKKADLREEVDSELWGDPDEEGSIPTSSTRILVAGGLAGIVGWGITFPIDVVKTKMQATSLPSPPPSRHPPTMTPATLPRDASHPYATMRSSFKSAYREGGGSYRVFVAGLGPTLVRSVPVNMVTFAVFELVVSTFR
ncbi:hypothetical protein JCM3766R1_004519 [Sporobolomyces carnicolor]